MKVWSEDLCILLQVKLKSITLPTVYYMYNAKRKTLKKILQSVTYAKTVPQVLFDDTFYLQSLVDMTHKGRLSERNMVEVTSSSCNSVSKEMLIDTRLVDNEVILQTTIYVSKAQLGANTNLLLKWR